MVQKERVFLVSLFIKDAKTDEIEESESEFYELCRSADLEIVRSFKQFQKRKNPTTYLGKGKIQEIANATKSMGIHTLIVNDNLTPGQARNISNITHCNVVDRTELILDIFAKHARTNQAKLQVELAQLEYSFSKLKHLWQHLSRIKGGIGFRGPGEKQIEVDRRAVKKRIGILKQRLENIKKTTAIKRKKRGNIISLALVGYTNTGKSTLFNLLTNESVYTKDKLFATLDATTRSIFISNNEKMIVTDTIGFIKNIPHKLVSSFHSTLTEVLKADLILHVADISQPNLIDKINAVNEVLKEIGAHDKNMLMVFNKCDLLDKTFFSFLRKKLALEYPDSVFISALRVNNISDLIHKFEEFIQKNKILTELHIPYKMQKLISFIYENSEILDQFYDTEADEQIVKLMIRRDIYSGIFKQIENYKTLEYLK